MTKQIVLRVDNVVKKFHLPTEQASGLKQFFVNWTKGIKGYRTLEILKGVSFTVQRGDFFGIVGRNGSGKSTLLKVISQIYTPEAGKVAVDGRLVPFIELGVGFNPELTGRENVYLNGALLGFSRQEMDEMYADIVEFAELHDFMDQKLKNYSSGMQVRLAFSIAIKAQGDILVLDEVLAVGDEAFQRKCDTFFDTIKKDKTKTVILVTHSMEAVKKYCNKAILLKDGKVAKSGDVYEVAETYSNDNLKALDAQTETTAKATSGTIAVRPVDAEQHIIKGDNFTFKIDFTYAGDKYPILAYAILDTKRGGVIYDSGPFSPDISSGRLVYKLPLAMFNNGEFKIIASLRERESENGELLPVAITGDGTSCNFILHNEHNTVNYGLLNNNRFVIQRLQ